MRTPAIDIRGVTRKFGHGRTSVTAVDNATFQINRGEVVALLGHNGAGKSTLLDMVMGLSDPTDGSIEVLGQRPGAVPGTVGAMLQSGGLLPDLTVKATAQMTAAILGDCLPVDDVLHRSGCTDFVNRRVGKCSGGQIQRLRFALALLPDPEILLLDEPTAGMDAEARRSFWTAMRREATEGRTIVFATHYLHEVDDAADRVILLQRGRIVTDMPVARLASKTKRYVTGVWQGTAEDAAHLVQSLGIPPEDLVIIDGRMRLTAPDGDAAVRTLLNMAAASRLEVRVPSVEDLFFRCGEHGDASEEFDAFARHAATANDAPATLIEE